MTIQIMVPVSNGKITTSTIQLASSWGRRLSGRVTGVGVLDEMIWAPASIAGTTRSPAAEMSETRDAMRARAEKHIASSLHELETSCEERHVEYRQRSDIQSLDGDLAAEAQRHDVVMLGREHVSDPGLGKSAREVLEMLLPHAPRPIVAVPEELPEGSGILLAYDGSLQASRAVAGLVGSGLAALGGVRVLSIHNKSSEVAMEHANRAVDYLAAHDIAAQPLPTHSESDVEDVIIDHAERHQAELIVMGAYGRPRLVEFFFGSVTNRLLETSPVPLFLFH